MQNLSLVDLPHQDADPGGFERLFDRILSRYADIGEKPVIELEKLPVLAPSLAPRCNSGQP
jgi:hypothetical protein